MRLQRIGTDLAVAAKLFRGFSDPTRLAIIRLLAGGELRVTDLVGALGCSQSNVSGHLSCLRECGLVDVRAEGRQSFYRLAVPETLTLLAAAEDILAATGSRIALCPRYSEDPS